MYFEAPPGRRWGHCLKSLSPHKRTPATAWRVVEAALCPKPPRAARARAVAVGRLTGERLPVAGATWWLSSTSCQDEQSSARLLEAEWAGLQMGAPRVPRAHSLPGRCPGWERAEFLPSVPGASSNASSACSYVIPSRSSPVLVSSGQPLCISVSHRATP